MLNAGDLARMAADLGEIIADNAVTITIRRQNTTLPPQTVRVEKAGQSRGRRVTAPGSEETRSDIVVAGPLTLDIKKDDRFTIDGAMYRVVEVRPNQQQGIQAQAELTS